MEEKPIIENVLSVSLKLDDTELTPKLNDIETQLDRILAKIEKVQSIQVGAR